MARTGTRRAPAARSRSSPALDAGLAALAAALAVSTFHRAMLSFFSADDFDGLARASALLPPRADLARFLPWHLFYPAFFHTFGLDAAPYHAASLAAHAVASALVFVWLKPLTGRGSALVGAVFYAVHPIHFDAVFWAAAIGDPLVAAFALLALVLRRRTGRERWLAVPAFALALLSKETAILVPLVAACEPVDPARHSPPRAARDPVVGTMAVLALGFVVYYVAADPFATHRAGAEAYVPTPGVHVGANLLAYASWTANFVFGVMRSISDRAEPALFPWGIVALAIGVAGALDPGLRRRGWLAGGALALAMLLPVLPLAHHTYRYYLSGPLAGAALCVAALASRSDEILNRGRARVALRVAVACVLAAALAVNGALVAASVEQAPFTRPGLRAEPIVDRALIAERVIRSLREAAPLPRGVTLRFWSPIARASAGLADSPAGESYWEKNVRTALAGGLGVRVAFPLVRNVEFVPAFAPAGDSVWYAVYREDGSLRAGPAGSLERALRRAP